MLAFTHQPDPVFHALVDEALGRPLALMADCAAAPGPVAAQVARLETEWRRTWPRTARCFPLVWALRTAQELRVFHRLPGHCATLYPYHWLLLTDALWQTCLALNQAHAAPAGPRGRRLGPCWVTFLDPAALARVYCPPLPFLGAPAGPPHPENTAVRRIQAGQPPEVQDLCLEAVPLPPPTPFPVLPARLLVYPPLAPVPTPVLAGSAR